MLFRSLAMVLSGSLLVTACGGTDRLPAASRSASMAGGVLEFSVVSDREHGFEMAYPAGWVRSEWVAPEGDDSSPLEYVLAYADPKGAQVDGVYVDAEQISIYRLSRSVAPQEIDRSLANKIVSLMLEDFPALSIRNKRLQRMTLRGVAVEGSEERRVGKECHVVCRSRWSPYH